MSETLKTDVVVIGGGPAGLSAAGWCTELGLSAVLLERGSDIGGQLHSIYGPIENYLGRRAENGGEMLRYFRESVARFDFVRRIGSEAISIDLPARSVVLGDGDKIAFRCLILATGVRRRRLGVPGEQEFREKGIIESGMRDRELVTGKKVVIVGGGDAAIENALILSELASSVTVVHRRTDFRARDEMLRKIDARGNVEFSLGSEVTKITGEGELSAVEVTDTASGRTRQLPADVVLIRIGVEPNSELVREIVELDANGYVATDALSESSADGIFAVGDVANPVSPTLSTAAGTGATAAKACAKRIREKACHSAETTESPKI
jgi:thioredoxin reductase (NADPH)